MPRVREKTLVYHYGDSWNSLAIVWKDSAGNPKDLTNYLASMHVRDETTDTLVLHLDSDVEGGLVVTPAEGKVSTSATPTKMMGGSLVQGQTYDYDIQVKSQDGSIIRTLLKGKFVVDEEQTNV